MDKVGWVLIANRGMEIGEIVGSGKGLICHDC